MDEKFYTRIRKDDFIIYQAESEINIKNILHYLKEQNIKGKCQVEYSLVENQEHYIYGTYMIKNFKIMGLIFPYASNQNNRKIP